MFLTNWMNDITKLLVETSNILFIIFQPLQGFLLDYQLILIYSFLKGIFLYFSDNELDKLAHNIKICNSCQKFYIGILIRHALEKSKLNQYLD